MTKKKVVKKTSHGGVPLSRDDRSRERQLTKRKAGMTQGEQRWHCERGDDTVEMKH